MNFIRKYFFYKRLRKLYRSLGDFKIKSELEYGDTKLHQRDLIERVFKRYKIYEKEKNIEGDSVWQEIQTNLKIYNYEYARNTIFTIRHQRAREINRCKTETFIPPKKRKG